MEPRRRGGKEVGCEVSNFNKSETIQRQHTGQIDQSKGNYPWGSMVWNRLFNYVYRTWPILFNGLSRLKIKNLCVIDYNNSSRIFCIWLSIVFMDLPTRERDKRVEGHIRHRSIQNPTFNFIVIVLLPIPDLLIQYKLSRCFP